MVGRDKLDCVPLFLGELAEDIFVCGKTINLLKLCCPEVQFLFVIVFQLIVENIFVLVSFLFCL